MILKVEIGKESIANLCIIISYDSSLLLSHHQGCRGERIREMAELPQLHQFAILMRLSLLLQGVDPMHTKRLTGHRSEQAFKRYTLRSEKEAAIAAFYRAVGEEAE